VNRRRACAVALALALPLVARGAEAVGVEEAVDVALQRNASLAVLSADLAAARARLEGASLLVRENPELELAAGPRRAGGDTSVDLELGVSQRLEVFGQQGLRRDVARRIVAAAEARLEMRRVEVAAEVREAFFRALAAGEQAKLAAEAFEVANEAMEAADARVRSGAAAQMEVNAARVAVGRAARERAEADRRRSAAVGSLIVLLGLDAREPFRLRGQLTPDPGGEADGEAILRSALERRQDLAAARLELEAARAESRLAGREALPSPRVGVAYAEEEDARIVRGGVAVDLPVFQRNQAGRGVARAQAEQAERAVEALERTIRAEVMVALERQRSAVAAAQAFAGATVASLAENLQLVNEAYRAGKVNLFELLVIRREALEARTSYLSALEELAAAQAELKRVAGSIR
jgi:cobalt-zinc-cadmium efflux system outer membrane protein